MSYILDALNKSDKERKKHETTAVNLHAAEAKLQTSHMPKFILLFMVFAIILWWGVNTSSRSPSDTTQLVAPTTTQAKQQQPSLPPKAIHAEPIGAESKQVKTNALEPTITQPQHIPHLMALDPNLRAELPPIRISAHIYSTNPQKRMVIINDRVLHEGDYISEQLTLNHIQTNSIELDYQGSPFTMGIKDSWPPY